MNIASNPTVFFVIYFKSVLFCQWFKSNLFFFQKKKINK